MTIRFKILQVVGFALAFFGLAAGFYFDFGEIRLPGHIPSHAWFTIILLGVFFRTLGEAGALRTKYKDRSETISVKEVGLSVVLASVLTGVVIWAAR